MLSPKHINNVNMKTLYSNELFQSMDPSHLQKFLVLIFTTSGLDLLLMTLQITMRSGT